MWLAGLCTPQQFSSCIFCGIASDDNARVIHRDDSVVAFADIDPAATVHILVRTLIS
jgi:diadenosine tetraphosphate (Ap4A) HIT family hydrolase